MTKDINTAGILARKAMIVTLNTSTWGARKTDKATTTEVTASKQAKNGVVNVTKAIINKDVLRPIREIITKMKQYHNANTLPWTNDGGRLLPTTKHADYTAFFRRTHQEFDDAVLAFLSEYKNHIAEASYFLGDLYSSDDYPDESKIKAKFDLSIDFDKVPEASDFRVDIPDYEQKRICQQIEARVERQHAESMKKVWQRIYRTIEHVYDRLKDEEAIFRNSLITNVQELVEILPSLNILEDENMNNMVQELSDTLCAHDPDELRKDRDKRKQVADNSKELLEKIGAYFDLNDQPANDPDPDPILDIDLDTDQNSDTDQELETETEET